VSTKKEKLQNVRHINAQQVPDSAVRYIMLEQNNSDDEVNLLDLWLLIVKRRFLLLSVLLICFLIGVVYSFSMPVKYTYSTAIEIGRGDYSKTGVFQPVEAPSSVLAKLQQSYIPLETRKAIEENPGVSSLPSIKAKLDKESDIIFIDINGEAENESLYINMLNSVVSRVKQDHSGISLLKRKKLGLSLKSAENKITGLRDQEQLLISQRKRLDKKQSLLEKRVSETLNLLKISTEIKQKAIKESRTEGKALVLMMVDSELRANRNLLAGLEEQLQINLENSREILNMKLAENLRQQAEKREMVEKINIQLNNLLETRAIIEPIRSIEPVGISKMLILIMSLMVGLFLGVFIVFLAEFFHKAGKYVAEKK